ncbi:MAG: MBL fold metallo-hydrolase, partial [Ramlibacter sp.]
MVTNPQSGTNVNEIAPGIYRINTPVSLPDGAGQFNFNQYLIVDEEPMLFHTGPRRMFPLVREAIDRVIPAGNLRYVGLSHFEADECGAMNEFLAVAPRAVPVCGRIAAMVSVNDMADRPARALVDGEILSLGKHQLRWFDAPHLPHAWECGLMLDTQTRTFFCGDLFTQPGAGDPPVTEGDILGPSEAFREHMDYFAHAPDTDKMLQRLATEYRAKKYLV